MTFKFNSDTLEWICNYYNFIIKIKSRKKVSWKVFKAGIKLKGGIQSHVIEASEEALNYINSLKEGNYENRSTRRKIRRSPKRT